MQSRLIKIVVLGVLGIGVSMYFRMSRRGDLGDTAKAATNEILTRVEGYEADRRFYEIYSDLAHSVALQEAYTVGGRRRRDSFDENVYINVFFGKLIMRARDEGKPEIVRKLQKLCTDESITPVT